MPSRPLAALLVVALLFAAAPALADAAAAPAADAAAAAAAAPVPSGNGGASIVAIVNGDVISREDVENRRRLFALSTGLPLSPDILDRLTAQITRQLIDERLRLQEIQRRRILVSDEDIAKAIADVEVRNNMSAGTLRKRLAADGVAYRTLVDQIRVQIGWTRVLRQQLGTQAQVTDADIAEQERLVKQEIGQQEFHVGEIFIPVEEPSQAEEARRFADTVIQQLRAGAPFQVVAAEFSQSQTALLGGDLGWVQTPQIDPAVLRVLNEMPAGAVSNPIRVPGGYDIVTLHAKREIGNDIETVADVRQAFLPFTSRLDPQNPTDQQKQTLAKAQQISASAHDCAAVEAAGTAAGSVRPPHPGEIRFDTVPPAMRAVLEKLPDNQASGPLVSADGILVIMVCSRTQKNVGIPTRAEISDRLINERVERVSRQLMRDLRRRAVIDQRSS
jgi:peptidyl-prolyl cis-trans isomerase SurA